MPEFRGDDDPLLLDYCAESATVHERATVERPCRIGERTVINRHAHVMPRAIIGEDCYIGQNVTLGVGVMLGQHVRILNNSMIISGAILENGVYCGPSTIIMPIERLRANRPPVSQMTPTLAREDACIGANCAIAAGLTLGRACFIEAGSVVDRNIPDFAIACGNPIILNGWRCVCGQTLAFEDAAAACTRCNAQYLKKSADKVTLAAPSPHLSPPRSVEQRRLGL